MLHSISNDHCQGYILMMRLASMIWYSEEQVWILCTIRNLPHHKISICSYCIQKPYCLHQCTAMVVWWPEKDMSSNSHERHDILKQHIPTHPISTLAASQHACPTECLADRLMMHFRPDGASKEAPVLLLSTLRRTINSSGNDVAQCSPPPPCRTTCSPRMQTIFIHTIPYYTNSAKHCIDQTFSRMHLTMQGFNMIPQFDRGGFGGSPLSCALRCKDWASSHTWTVKQAALALSRCCR